MENETCLRKALAVVQMHACWYFDRALRPVQSEEAATDGRPGMTSERWRRMTVPVARKVLDHDARMKDIHCPVASPGYSTCCGVMDCTKEDVAPISLQSSLSWLT